MEPLLTKAEAAKILRCTERQVDRLRTFGLLTCVKVGISVCFTRAELERYIADNVERKAKD
jgi:excisionase family DNA binding protein